jgi:hypothetical protein
MLEFVGLLLYCFGRWLRGASWLPPLAMACSPSLRGVWFQAVRGAGCGCPDFGPAGWCPVTVVSPAAHWRVNSGRQRGLRLASGQAPPFTRKGLLSCRCLF